MATIARLYDFTPGTVIRSGEVDAEFNQIMDLLNGTSQDLQVYVQLDDNALSVVKLNQAQTGTTALIQEWYAGGVQVAKIDGVGRFTNTVVGAIAGTGNAPFVVASQKVVTNLNADLLDGKHYAEIIADALAGTPGSLTIASATPCLTFNDTDLGDVGDVRFCLYTDGTPDQQLTLERVSDSLAIQRWNVDFGTSQFHNIVVLRAANGDDIDITASVGGSSTPQHLTPKKYVDALKTRWSVGAFFPGEIDTGMVVGEFIVPNDVVEFKATHLKIIYQTGTPSGDSTVSFSINGTPYDDATLTSGTAVETVVSVTLTPATLSAGDVIKFVCTAAGAHEDVTVQLCGTQKVSYT